MNDFVKQNKIPITVFLSIVFGLTWSLVYIYVLMPMFPLSELVLQVGQFE